MWYTNVSAKDMPHDEDEISDCDPDRTNLKAAIDTNAFRFSRADAAFIERLPQALSYAANLDVGDHAILFYDNLVVAAEYFSAYIEEGINRHETTCITGLPRDRYEKLFSQLGIKVATLENCGYLRHIEIHGMREDHKPFQNKVRQAVESLLRANLERKYQEKRLIILSDWPTDNVSAQELIEFEKWLSTSPYPASVICGYGATEAANEANSNMFARLLKNHRHCIFQGIGMPTRILLGDHLSAYPKLGYSGAHT